MRYMSIKGVASGACMLYTKRIKPVGNSSIGKEPHSSGGSGSQVALLSTFYEHLIHFLEASIAVEQRECAQCVKHSR